ncbi:MAG: putative quinol monooxygenase [Steroidobacteraceae bacterium]
MSRITFISRMTVKPGRERDFVAACSELTELVHAKEKPIYFEFFKLREPRRYAVLESFPDEASEHAHMNSPWLAAIVPRIVDCVDGTWEREYLDAFEP